MKIDKNIPIPKSRAIYGFNKMEIGDSAWFINAERGARSAAYLFGLRNKQKFISRAEGCGYRIWRIK